MHKVSQDEAQMLALFKAMAPGCWDAGYKSHGGSLAVPFLLLWHKPL